MFIVIRFILHLYICCCYNILKYYIYLSLEIWYKIFIHYLTNMKKLHFQLFLHSFFCNHPSIIKLHYFFFSSNIYIHIHTLNQHISSISLKHKTFISFLYFAFLLTKVRVSEKYVWVKIRSDCIVFDEKQNRYSCREFYFTYNDHTGNV